MMPPEMLKGLQRLLRHHAYEPIPFLAAQAFKSHTDFENAVCVMPAAACFFAWGRFRYFGWEHAAAAVFAHGGPVAGMERSRNPGSVSRAFPDCATGRRFGADPWFHPGYALCYRTAFILLNFTFLPSARRVAM
jgi:hypothetical protein